MYKLSIAPLLIITLTGIIRAANTGSKYSVSSKITMSGVNLRHAGTSTPSLSASRCPSGTGSAFTPGFVRQVSKHSTIGTVSSTVTVKIDPQEAKRIQEIARVQATMHNNRRTDSGKR